MKDQIANIDTAELSEITTQLGNSLFDLSLSSPVLLIFLRPIGCVFCVEAIHDLVIKKQEITARGIKLVFVHMADEKTASVYFSQYDLSSFESISDPECIIYEKFGLTKGSFNQLYGLKVLLRGFQANRGQDNPRKFKQIGDGFQMPGIFILKKGKIVDAYIHQKTSDRPDYDDLISSCASSLS